MTLTESLSELLGQMTTRAEKAEALNEDRAEQIAGHVRASLAKTARLRRLNQCINKIRTRHRCADNPGRCSVCQIIGRLDVGLVP